MPNFDEVMALIDGAATKPSSSSQPQQNLSFEDITNSIPTVVQEAPSPSVPTAYDELAALQTKSTGLNSVVRGVLGFGSNVASAFGDFETASNLDLTTKTYFAPEAPNIMDGNVGTFAYESLASNTPQLAATLGLAAIPVVGIPLALASVAVPLYGESRKAIVEGTGTDDPYAALIPASINTALDLAVPVKIAKKLGLTSLFKETVKKEKDAVFSTLAKDTASTASLEGATEVAQWATNLATVRFLGDGEVLKRLTPDEQNEAVNNFFGGVFGGGGFGLGASAYGLYKQGQTQKALEAELGDLDALLAELDTVGQASPPATVDTPPAPPAAASNTPAGTNVLPTDTPPDVAPTATKIPAKVGIIHSTANAINAYPEPLRNVALGALQTRRDELLNLISSIDTRMAERAQGEAPPIKLPNEQHFVDGKLEIHPSIATFFSKPQWVMSSDGQPINIPNNVQRDSLPPVTYFGDEKAAQVLDIGEKMRQILVELGLDTAPDGQPIRILLGQNQGEDSYANIAFDAAAIAMNIGTKDVTDAEVVNAMYHELGHYVGTRLITDADTVSPVERQALLAAYNSYIQAAEYGIVPTDKLKAGTPGFKAFWSTNKNFTKFRARNQYETSFSEYVAEGFRQALLNRTADGSMSLKDLAPNFYDKTLASFRRLFRMKKQYLGASNAGIDTFQDFVDKALATRELQEIEAKLANQTNNAAKEIVADAPKAKEELPKETPKKKIKPKDPAPTELIEEFEFQMSGRGLPAGSIKTWGELDKAYSGLKPNYAKIYNRLQGDFHEAMKAYREQLVDKKKSLDVVSETLETLGMKKQASNVSQVMSVNMGILGDNVLGRFFRTMLTPIQVAEQAENRGFVFGQLYMDIVQKFQLMKTTVVELADTTLRTWRQGGKESTDKVSKALFVISTKSDELGRRLNQAELDLVFSTLNMDQKDQDAWAAVDASFITILTQMEASTILDVARTYNPNPRDKAAAKAFRDAYLLAKTEVERNKLIEDYTGVPVVSATMDVNPMLTALSAANKSLDGMRNKNYFPRSRLGEYVVRVRSKAKGDVWEGHTAKVANETLGFYAFDTEAEQKAFLESIANEVTSNGLQALGHKLDSEVFSVMGLPAGIIEQVVRDMDADPRTRLAPLQRELLNDIALQRAPGKRFLRHMTKRRGIAGFSEDAVRVYANYVSSASNHLARSEYAPDMASVLSDMQALIQNPGQDVANVNDWNSLKDYFTKHFDYLMKPDNDWATLRSVGFLWYLGFNVKSALVNLMQTPMVTLPVLSRDIGTAKAAGRLSTAMKDTVQHLRGKSNMTADELNMIDYMLKANLIDESLVSELAGLGEADVLKRLIPGMNAANVLTQVSWYGGTLFRMGEKFNRYTTVIAAYRIARSDLRLGHEEAIQYAVKGVQASQFEYAKFNRPEFMRGKKSVIFLFWQYLQHASYLFFGGKGARVAKRMWIMAFALAGLEGLPFAQLLMKTIDFGGTAMRDLFGVANPKIEVNKMIREMILNIYDRPDDIMKGMSYQWGLGPFHLLRPLGVPVPNVTTEGSLGFGNPVPWFDGLLDPNINEMDKALGKTAATLLGPIGGMLLGVVEAVGYSKEEDQWKRWEKTLPVFMKNASQGIRWGVQGEETTSNQMQVVQFETPEQRAEVALKSLGFTPTRIDQTRRQMRAAQESVLYHQTRKQMLLDDFWYAKQTKDREFLADVRQSIRDFNNEVREAGMPAFIIKGDSLTNSLSERAKARALSERGISADRRERAARQQAERLIPVTGE